MPVNLLSLPFVAWKHVLHSLGFVELYALAMVSKSMEQMIKRNVKVKGYKMGILINQRVTFFLIDSLENTLFCQMEVDPSEANDFLYKFQDLFNVPVESIEVNFYKLSMEPYPIFQWINTFQYEMLLVNGVDLIHNDFITVLACSRPVDTLKIELKRTFLLISDLKINPKIDCVIIDNANWMNKKHLLSLQNRKLEIKNSQLTNQKINEYLLNIKAGLLPNLREICIEVNEGQMNMDIVLANLTNNFELDNGDKCQIICYRASNGNQGIEVHVTRKED